MEQKLVIFFLLIVSCFNDQLEAQSPADAFKKLSVVPLQSPQVASLSKYVEFPVSYYNGLAQISFPVYEVKSGDISVPVTLSYHGAGVKVQEEASWTGLGWALNAGGIISHDIKGEDDDYGNNHRFNKVFPDNFGNAYRGPYSLAKGMRCYNSVFTKEGISYNCAELYTQLNGGNVDGEPDIYVYNFGPYSGKFFSGDGEFVDLSHNNIHFTQQYGTGFTARCPDGFTYTFNALEKSWTYPTTHATTTAYYLTNIRSPRGKVVTFQYKPFKTMIDEHDQPGQVQWSSLFPNISAAWGNDGTVMQLPALSERYTVRKLMDGYSDVVPTEEPGLHQTYSSTTSTNLYLDKIVFNNGYVDFIKSPRNDLYGVKLDSIKVHRTDGSLVKSVPFTYGYFASNAGGDDLYDRAKVKYPDVYDAHVDNYPPGYRNQRLKLISIMLEANAHSFEYHEGDQLTLLPYKTSFNQDFWGYYNGPKGNTSLIPDYSLYSLEMNVPGELSTWRGANRNPDNNYIRAGILKRINYPTGGYSEFTHEMNQFDNLSAQQQNVYREVKYGGIDAGAGIKTYYFTLTKNTYCDITGGLYCNEMQDMNAATYNCSCFCSGQNTDALYAYIDKVDPVTHATITHDINLEFDISKNAVRNAGGTINMPGKIFSAGTYSITVNYPDSHVPAGDVPNNRRAELYVSFYEADPDQTASVAVGAGLRVSSIKQFDPVNMQLMERKFTYTGGKIMRYPMFYVSTSMQYSSPNGGSINNVANYMFYYLYSSPSMPYSFSANGNAGGYNLVTETAVGSSFLGKTQYAYKNIPDRITTEPGTYLPGVPGAAYLDNGFLTNVSVYDKTNTLVKETVHDPVIGIPKTYWAFKGRFPCDVTDSYNFSQYFQFSFYPVQVGKLLINKTTETDYLNGRSITTVNNFSYNENGLLRQQTSAGSDSIALSTNYSYASDYIGVTSGWLKDLKDKNMIGFPIEVYNKRNGLVIGGNFTTYLNHDNIITPDRVYKIETSFARDISSTAPNAAIPAELKLSGSLLYNSNGNLVQTRAENDMYTSYLWGYNKSYPVAQVIGADYAAINALINSGAVSQSVLDDPQSTAAQLTQQLTSLRIGLAGTKALIITYTYNPLVGIASETNVNRLTTYYNYDSYNRLANIKDHAGNIINSNSYYYSPTLKDFAKNAYYNNVVTQVFSKQCALDAFNRPQIGSDVPYKVDAGRYAGISQEEANARAQAEIDANGQAKADSLGTCYLYAGPLDLLAVQNGLDSTVRITYKCPFNVDYLYLLIQDVATGEYVNNRPFNLSIGRTRYNVTITKGRQYKFWLTAGGHLYPASLTSQTNTIDF